MTFDIAWGRMLHENKHVRRPSWDPGRYWLIVDGQLHESDLFNASGTEERRTALKELVHHNDLFGDDFEVCE
jgi:hypothetical protein